MKKRKIVQYTKENVPVRTYDSIREAEAEHHITHISSVCRHKRLTDGGFVWRYAEFPDPEPVNKKRGRN